MARNISPNIDTIHFTSHPAPSSQARSRHILIYLISGNPGVITFYGPFLSHLTSLLSTSHPTTNFTVSARSLSGFEISPSTPRPAADCPRGPPYSLNDQVRHVAEHLNTSLENLERQGWEVEVVLLGHSVGSYILFEILRLYHEGDLRGGLQEKGITAGVCLFPTIADLGKSPRGVWLSKVLSIPGIWIPLVVLGRIITLWGWGSGVLIWVLINIVGQDESRARGMIGWFGSEWGIREAVVMGRHEFAQMLDDTWSDEIWQMSTKKLVEGRKGTKLFFFWGKDDYWVDSINTRDRIIRARESKDVVMEVDTIGIDHAFCLEGVESEVVARKVAGYIETLL